MLTLVFACAFACACQSNLYDVAFSPVMKLAACAGDTGVKLVDCNNGFENLKPDGIDLSGEGGQTSKVGWSPDGQILTVGTTTGHIHAFLARMRIVHGNSGAQVAYLSSLREVSVVDVRQMDMVHKQLLKIPVTIEPQFIALGAMHCAVGINNRVYYHRCLPKDTTLVDEQEYVGRVEKVCINERYAKAHPPPLPPTPHTTPTTHHHHYSHHHRHRHRHRHPPPPHHHHHHPPTTTHHTSGTPRSWRRAR